MKLNPLYTTIGAIFCLTLAGCNNPVSSPAKQTNTPVASKPTTEEVKPTPAPVKQYAWDEIVGWDKAQIYLQKDASEFKPLPMSNANGKYYSAVEKEFSVCIKNLTDETLALSLSIQGKNINQQDAEKNTLIQVVEGKVIRCFANTEFKADQIPVIAWTAYKASKEQKSDESLLANSELVAQGSIYLSQDPIDSNLTPWKAQ